MDAASDPFAALRPEEMNGAGGKGPASSIVMPAPTEPPKQPRHREHGQASYVWVYRDSQGHPLMAAARFDKRAENGVQAKVVLPMTHTANGKTAGWQFGTIEQERPLYGLDRLAEEPAFPVLVCEGEKTADAAMAIFTGHIVVTSSGGASAAGRTSWTPLRGRHVVIWPDADEPGRRYARHAAEQIKQAGAASVRIVDVPQDWPTGWDVADPLPPGVTIETLHQMAEVHADPRALTVLTPAQCELGDARPYVVKGLIARGDHAMFIGAPGSGKSAAAPLGGYSIALGIPFFGLRVRQGRVLYLAAEDGHGMRLRVRALRKRLGDTADFLLVPDCLDLMNADSGDVERVCKLIAEYRPIAVFLDTVARAFPGLRENDSDSMGRVVTVVRQLANQDCRPAIITVHHVAKDAGTTPRGHGILNGDLDVIMLIEGEKAEPRIVKLGKNRNGSSDTSFAFAVESEEVGQDEDGDPVTAPIAAPIEGETPNRKAKIEAKLKDKQALALRELRDLIDRHGTHFAPGIDYPMVHGVSRELFRSRLVDRAWFEDDLLRTLPDGKTQLDRKAFTAENHALTALKRKGLASFNRENVWLL